MNFSENASCATRSANRQSLSLIKTKKGGVRRGTSLFFRFIQDRQRRALVPAEVEARLFDFQFRQVVQEDLLVFGLALLEDLQFHLQFLKLRFLRIELGQVTLVGR